MIIIGLGMFIALFGCIGGFIGLGIAGENSLRPWVLWKGFIIGFLSMALFLGWIGAAVYLITYRG